MTDVRPFRVDVPDSVLNDLQQRLERVRWPDEPPYGAPWQFGTDCTMTVSRRGGHFAALEEPERLAEDVRAFFRSVRD